MFNWSRTAWAAPAVAAIAFAAAGAGAQDAYPSRPIRFILPFPPGGGTDILGRILSERLAGAPAQPVVIENRGGAGSNLGAEAAARSAPDGYTIVLAAPSLAISPGLYSKLGYDPIGDFTPISLVATVPNVIITHPAIAAQSLAEFIALADEAGRNEFRIGWERNVESPRRRAVQSRRRREAGSRPLQRRQPGHKRRALRTGALRGDRHSAAAPHIKSGRLRALAVIAPQRAPALPEVPTAAEAGLANFEVTTWYGALAPAGTPRPIINRLNAELARIMHAPELKDRLASMATEPATSTPEECAAYLKREILKWGKVVREAGLKAD